MKFLYHQITFFAKLICCLLCSTVQAGAQANNLKSPPNIVFIFADDLGYGDLGCFGATDIKTPHIDQIAAQGIKFTDFYSAASVCSPSRAALLTGKMPQRMGINGVFFPDSYTGMASSEITMAELLKEKGYATGIVGKWHLGHRNEFLPLQQGFDEYFGIPYSNDMTTVVYMRGNEVEEFKVDQHYTTQKYTEEALQFIDHYYQKPFFLYLAHNMPHVPIYASENFLGTSQRGLYGDVIQEIDWSVGEIVRKLKDLNLLENTLIVFSSDNGPWLVMEDHGGSAGPLREGKQFSFEGGMRVPTIAMWGSHIKPGTVYRNMATQMDWFPTFARLAGVEIPKDRPIDGEDISDVLLGKGERKSQKFLFFEGGSLQGYRSGDWKIKKPFPGVNKQPWRQSLAAHDTLLINLKNDPGEKNNLAAQYPEKAKALFQEMEAEYKKLGKLPPSLFIRSEADHSHYQYLDSKHKSQKE